MRCYICDEIIKDDKVRVNFITKKIEPCMKCMESVHSVVDSYQEQEIEVFPDTEEAFWADGGSKFEDDDAPPL